MPPPQILQQQQLLYFGGSLENIEFDTPVLVYWAVSQQCPLRHITIDGSLNNSADDWPSEKSLVLVEDL